MDAETIQLKVWMGYGKASIRVGPLFDIFRSDSMINPLDAANKIGTVNASFTTGMEYSSYNKPTAPMWTALVDATDLKVGDWLSREGETFYIADIQNLLPIPAVGCSAVVDIARPGYGSVGGGFGTQEELIAQGLPVFMLNKKDKTSAPHWFPAATDSAVSLPEWNFYINTRELNAIRAHDVIIGDQLDAQGERCRYEIASLTLTSFGYIVNARLEKP